MKTSGIYGVRNLVNGKRYVGRSVDISRRWEEHKSSAKNGSKFPLHCAIRKYGVENFEMSVLERSSETDLSKLECAHIGLMGAWAINHGYNVGGTKGGFPSKAEMALMDALNRARWLGIYKASGKSANAALSERRKDPEFFAKYKAAMSSGGKEREARINSLRKTDPAYDAHIHEMRSKATSGRKEGYQVVAGKAFKEKFKSDPEFAKKVSASRSSAGKARVLKQRARMAPIIEIAKKMRREGATLKTIGDRFSLSQAWVSINTKGAKDAFVP